MPSDGAALVAFQPTPLREGRLRESNGGADGKDVSTHAPARGATRNKGMGPAYLKLFQPTPLREGRLRHF